MNERTHEKVVVGRNKNQQIIFATPSAMSIDNAIYMWQVLQLLVIGRSYILIKDEFYTQSLWWEANECLLYMKCHAPYTKKQFATVATMQFC